MKRRVVFPREVLLVEVERWCGDPLCNARTRVALTKADAREYAGFECARCGLWKDDALDERDIPDWWEELKITSLDGVRASNAGAEGACGEGEVVERMSAAWKSLGGREDTFKAENEGEAGDSF
jgi:hypothetical protein